MSNPFSFDVLLTLRHAAALRLVRDAGIALDAAKRGSKIIPILIETAEEDIEAWLAVKQDLRHRFRI